MMGNAVTVVAWIMCGLGFLAAFGEKFGVPRAAAGVLLALAVILGGTGIVLSRRVELAGRFGGKVVITGTAAILFGLGMIVAPIGGFGFALVTKYSPGTEGRVWGGLSIFVVGAGLFLTGMGMWLEFALKPWQGSRGEALSRRIFMLVVRTWGFGWIGLVGVGLMIGGLVVAGSILTSGWGH
jgi:hypothetical protein